MPRRSIALGDWDDSADIVAAEFNPPHGTARNAALFHAPPKTEAACREAMRKHLGAAQQVH